MSRIEAAIDTILNGSAAGLAVWNPAAGVAAAAAVPGLSAGARVGLDRFAVRRRSRRGVVLDGAAAAAGISVSELLNRCESAPEREDLLLTTLRAAGHTSSTETLIAYAVALVQGSLGSGGEAPWESEFVRALDDLDEPEVHLAKCFTMTSNELGLGSGGPEFDVVPDGLNEEQLKRVARNPERLPIVIAALQRQGLIATPHGSSRAGPPSARPWTGPVSESTGSPAVWSSQHDGAGDRLSSLLPR